MALSRQGRRLTGPVPRWAGGLGALILFAYIIAFTVRTESVTAPVVCVVVPTSSVPPLSVTAPVAGSRLLAVNASVPPLILVPPE